MEGLAERDSIDMAVVGSKLVAQKFLEIASERDLPVDNLAVVATPNSAGNVVRFGDREIEVGLASETDWSEYDIVLNAAASGFSKEHAEGIVAQGPIFIDTSSDLRKDPRVPIVISEVNPGAIAEAKLGIIAKPNCTTTIGTLALHYLHQEAGLFSLDVDTYQSDSGQGQPGLDEHDRLACLLIERGDELVHGQTAPYPSHEIYPVIPVFNAAPVAGVFENGSDHTTEELKYKNETRKILGLNPEELRIDVTCARSGGYNCHGLSIHAEFEDAITSARAQEILAEAEGIQLHEGDDIPQPIYVAGTDPVHVGRIRQSERFGHNGLKFWVLGDNLRKGAALNAVQIVELLIQK